MVRTGIVAVYVGSSSYIRVQTVLTSFLKLWKSNKSAARMVSRHSEVANCRPNPIRLECVLYSRDFELPQISLKIEQR